MNSIVRRPILKFVAPSSDNSLANNHSRPSSVLAVRLAGTSGSLGSNGRGAGGTSGKRDSITSARTLVNGHRSIDAVPAINLSCIACTFIGSLLRASIARTHASAAASVVMQGTP